MKIRSASLKAVIVASLAFAAGFASADTQTLTVTAKVVGTCKFSASTGTLSFGQLDQSVSTDATKTADVLYKCTKNTKGVGITVTTTTLEMKNAAKDVLPFTLAVTSDKQDGLGLADGTTTDLTAKVTGTITGANVQAAAAGDYAQDVTLTITN